MFVPDQVWNNTSFIGIYFFLPQGPYTLHLLKWHYLRQAFLIPQKR